MSKPREPWWGYVKNVLRSYPELKRELDELKRSSITPNYNANGGGAGISMPTESAVLRELPKRKQERYEAVTGALARTRKLRDGTIRCRLIEKVYFRKSHTLSGAAMACHVSYDTAINWHGEFIRLVAENLNLL